MTQPLHSSKRLLLAIFFIILFVLFIPVVLLYSMGYRLDKDFSLTSTGGIYVFYPESGAKVYLNGSLSEQTSLFERGLFIDDLEPGPHSLEVTKTGYRTWDKNVEVKKKRVTEAYPFLIPEIVSTSSVPRFITLNSGATVTNNLYGNVTKLFATTTSTSASTSPAALKEMLAPTSTTLVASSTAVGIIKKDIQISIEGNYVIASWKGNRDSAPFYLCDAERLECEDDLIVVEGDIKHVDFYPGRNDVILYSTKEGIFVTELDKREPQNTHKLLSGDLEFREDDQRVFVKEKNNYYELLFTASTTINNAISI